MSFDIYGNNLRRGHCEVHPDVHEEYPCFVCLKESSARAQKATRRDPSRIEELEYNLACSSEAIKQRDDYIRSLEQELEALKASQSKVKADGIREAVKQVKRPIEGSSMESLCLIDDLLNFAAQLEKGE